MRRIGDKLVDLGELFPEGNAEVGELSQNNLLTVHVSFLFYFFPTLTEPPIQRRLRRYWPHDLLVRFKQLVLIVILVCKFPFPAVSTGFRTPY
jgi:hypothetical protein